MGQPVVHFEVIARDEPVGHRIVRVDLPAEQLRVVGLRALRVLREGNTNPEGIGIGGGIGAGPEGYPGHATYVEVPDVEEALAKAESLGGTRMMGPDKPMEGLEVGLFKDPEGNIIGLAGSVG